jgi:dihydrofolate reductase
MDHAMQPLGMIWAMNQDRAIGERGGLPWRISEDLRYFKRITLCHAVIMGRKTWDEVGKPLPGRHNIVISRQVPKPKLAGATVCASVEEALDAARTVDPFPYVIGGAQIYAAYMPLATELRMTLIQHEAPNADTFFPAFDLKEWEETERVKGETAGLEFVTLLRKHG